jgi:hypothetical protein
MSRLAYIKTNQAYAIRSLFDSLSPLFSDGSLRFNELGLSLFVSNSSTSADVKILKESVEEFSCPKPINIGVDFSHIQNACRDIRKGDSLTLEITSDSLTKQRLLFSIYAKGSTINKPFFYREIMTKQIQNKGSIQETELTLPNHRYILASTKFKAAISSLNTKCDNDSLSIYQEAKEDKFLVLESRGTIHNIKNLVPFEEVQPADVAPDTRPHLYSYPTITTIAKCFSGFITIAWWYNSTSSKHVYFIVPIGTLGVAKFRLACLSDIKEDAEDEEEKPKLTKFNKKRKQTKEEEDLEPEDDAPEELKKKLEKEKKPPLKRRTVKKPKPTTSVPVPDPRETEDWKCSETGHVWDNGTCVKCPETVETA